MLFRSPHFDLSKRKAEFPPNPPSAFPFLKRNGNGSRRAKIPSPQPPSFLPACLGFAPKTFGRTGFMADRFFSLPHHPCAENFKELPEDSFTKLFKLCIIVVSRNYAIYSID